MIFSKIEKHTGPLKEPTTTHFPIGMCKVTTNELLSLAYIEENGEIINMFVLNPGTHRVKVPNNVKIVVNCDKKTDWSVRWPSRFEKADSTRVAAALIRPLTQQEEMHDYMQEVLARSQRTELQNQMRAGNVEIDVTNEDWRDHIEEDHDSPLSVHQLELMVEQLRTDFAATQKRQQQNNTPSAEPQQATRGDGNPNQTDIEDSPGDQKQPNRGLSDQQKHPTNDS